MISKAIAIHKEQPNATRLRVLAADEDRAALDSITGILRELGHEVSALAVSISEAAERVVAEDPDLAVVVVHRDAEHALDLIGELSEYASGPVVAVVEGGDAEFLHEAAERGLYAYARLQTAEEVQGAIEVAMRRHAEVSALNERVDRLEGALERRAVIERAKGIVMERQGVGEREAFELLRSAARASNRRVVDLAAAVQDSHGLLPREPGQEPGRG